MSNVSQMLNVTWAKKFNQNLDKWDVSNVVDMESMFKGANSFNGKIENWNVQKVGNIS
ncbi:BspA family leucine-rich repeat surface protein [Mycoplasmopsis bovis]|nr:BspA family leucine-rich repeat surface protein [Mycoplasmopsis bovis]QQH36185.1 BspA family leucine-rich repeat surface protein [Mycoplasmopsis bovis]